MELHVSIPKRVSEALKLTNYSLFLAAKVGVSIPKRVSEALKLATLEGSLLLIFVSIPKRVSEALKPSVSLLAANNNRKFQSLKGFQRL